MISERVITAFKTHTYWEHGSEKLELALANLVAAADAIKIEQDGRADVEALFDALDTLDEALKEIE